MSLFGLANGQQTIADALAAERRALTEEMGLAEHSFDFPTNGSGSPDSRATPRAVVQLLTRMAQSTVGEVYHAALPVLSADGSLAGTGLDLPARATSPPRQGRPISDGVLKAQNLAGYIEARSGRRLAFALFVAGPAPLSAAFGGAFLAALQAPGGADAVLFGGSRGRPARGPGSSRAPPWRASTAPAGGARQWQDVRRPPLRAGLAGTWNPVLTQAPSGRVGDLWAATPPRAPSCTTTARAGRRPRGGRHSVAAGADGSAYCVGVDAGAAQLCTAGTEEQRLGHGAAARADAVPGGRGGRAPGCGCATPATPCYQLQRGGGQAVSAAVPRLGTPVHIAANADGTVWGCDGIQPTAFRLISEATRPAGRDRLGAPGPVHKVASTGFGAAYRPGGPGRGAQLYRYDSPYVFKTSRPYLQPTRRSTSIETGLGNLYLTVTDGPPGAPGGTSYVVALDVHTGQEVSRSGASPQGTVYTKPVFDPVHEVVIVSPVQRPAPPPGRASSWAWTPAT